MKKIQYEATVVQGEDLRDISGSVNSSPFKLKLVCSFCICQPLPQFICFYVCDIVCSQHSGNDVEKNFEWFFKPCLLQAEVLLSDWKYLEVSQLKPDVPKSEAAVRISSQQTLQLDCCEGFLGRHLESQNKVLYDVLPERCLTLKKSFVCCPFDPILNFLLYVN